MSRGAPASHVDQTLHGYRSGHRLLGGSTPLSDRSAALMLGLSDLLAEPGRAETYLVGYPLREMNRYVLARTWLASEMPRPGCVWTHSLIIDYASLARLDDPSVLLSLHRRPSGSAEGYNEALALPSGSPARVNDRLDPKRTLDIVSALYTGSGTALLAAESQGDETLALAAWRQMWPRMRRGFFFCTATATPVAVGDVEGSLQFLLNADQHRAVGRPVPPPTEVVSIGLEILAADAPQRARTDLRRFLARYAPELPDHRLAAPRLAAIYSRLGTARTEPDMTAAVAMIEAELPADQARLLKADLLLGRFRDPDVAGPAAARDFAVSVQAFADQPPPIERSLLAEHMIELCAERRLSLPALAASASAKTAGTLGDAVFDILAKDLAAEAATAKIDHDLKVELGERNPGLFMSRAFWPEAADGRLRLLEAALFRGVAPTDLLDMLMDSLNEDEALILAEAGGDAVTSKLLGALPNSRAARETARVWLPLLPTDPETLREALEVLWPEPELLDLLVTPLVGTPADRVLNDIAIAGNLTVWDGAGRRCPALVTLSLLRGLERDSYMAGDMIAFALDPLLQMIFAGVLPARLLAALDTSLPRPGFFSGTDLPTRILKAIADRYVAIDRADLWILRASDDMEALRSILLLVEERLYGRGLLKDLHHRAGKAKSGVPAARLKVLEKVLWPYKRSRGD